MSKKMTDEQRASRKRAKWLAELKATLTEDELNVETLKGMGLSDADIRAVLGDSGVIIDVEYEELSTDEAIDSDSEPSIHLPAVIPTTKASDNQGNSIKYTQWSEEWWEHAKPEVRQRRCKAHRKDGGQCLKAAINGARVCRYHGGAAKHVKRAARARLENATDRMAKALLGMATDANVADSVKLSAIKDALDRGGLKAPEELVVSAGQQSGFDEIAEDLQFTTISREESRAARGYQGSESIGYQPDSMDESPPIQSEPPRPSGPSDEDTSPTERPEHSDSEPPPPPYADERRRRRQSRRDDSQNRSYGFSEPITGYDAIRLANEANGLIADDEPRYIGDYVLPPVRALPPGQG